MNYRSSSQAFKFDILITIRLLEIIKDEQGIDINKIVMLTGMGEPKVKENISYMRFCDLLDGDNINYFGNGILAIKNSSDIVEQLLLYKLSRGSVNGGHYYFSRLMNQVLYDYAFQINNTVSRDQILKKALMCEEEKEFSRDSNKGKENNFLQALNQGLCDTTTGFGKMGMVVQKDGAYEISGYIPHRLVTAYILYDNWPDARNALKLDELFNRDYFPAKIFFMGQDLIKEQIYYLTNERILYLEEEAGLNQVRLSPELNSDKILDRIVDSCLSN